MMLSIHYGVVLAILLSFCFHSLYSVAIRIRVKKLPTGRDPNPEGVTIAGGGFDVRLAWLMLTQILFFVFL